MKKALAIASAFFWCLKGQLFNHAKGVYHQGVSLAYHQHEVLYIIKPKGGCTLARDEIQGRLAALDDMRRTSCVDDMSSLWLG